VPVAAEGGDRVAERWKMAARILMVMTIAGITATVLLWVRLKIWQSLHEKKYRKRNGKRHEKRSGQRQEKRSEKRRGKWNGQRRVKQSG